MLNRITAYYGIHKRNIKKYTRTTFTRPIKDKLHNYQIYLVREITDIKATFFQVKNLRFLGIFVIFFWLFRDFAFAASTTEPTKIDAMGATVDTLNGVLFVIVTIAKPLVMFIGRLLSPDWTFGDIIGLRPVLHQIWIYISNVVYFIFAIMLVVIALMNIFSENASFALKKSLPKLIIGILMVPFTWFIVSATLSVANVLTASVLTIPFDTIMKIPDNNKLSESLDEINVPTKLILNLNESSGAFKTGDEKTTLGELLKSERGAYNLVAVYAYGIFKIQDAKMLDGGNIKTVTSVMELFKKLLSGILFAIVFSILVIAITFALFTRMAMLWIFAMFSPLFALSFFLGGTKSKTLEKIGKLSVTKFISLAMVPVYVSAALSFGLMFLSITQNSIKPGASQPIKPCNDGTVNCQQLEFGKLKLQIIGSWSAKGAVVGKQTVDTVTGFISSTIINILALIILWMAVMAALGANEITESAVKPIADFGNSMGKLMVDAPKYIPLKLPLGGKSVPISMAGLDTLRGAIEGDIRGAAQKQASEFATATGIGKGNAASDIDRYLNANPNKESGNGDELKKYLDFLNKKEPISTLLDSPKNKESLMKGFADKLGLKGDDSKNFIKLSDSIKTNTDLAKAIVKSGAAPSLIGIAFGGTKEEDVIKKLDSLGSNANNSEGNTNPASTKPELYPHKVTIEKKDGKPETINMNITGSDGRGGASGTPISIKISDFNKQKLKDVLEAKNIKVKDDNELSKLADAIIDAAKDSVTLNK